MTVRQMSEQIFKMCVVYMFLLYLYPVQLHHRAMLSVPHHRGLNHLPESCFLSHQINKRSFLVLEPS